MPAITLAGGGNKSYIEELWVSIKADLTQLKTSLASSSAMLKSYATNIDNSSNRLKTMGRSVGIVGIALAGLSAIIVSTFAKFEQSMANTFSVLGATSDEMQKLEMYARKMGETTIFKASDAADAMYYLASAGYNAEQVMGSLKGTLMLAAATQYDLAESTRLVVTLLNAYSLAATDASRVSNVLAAVISKSQATMDRLVDSFKYVGPIAAQLGISIEQTSAALGILYNSGLAASQAGTYLRQGLIRLQKPTKEAMDAILDMGLSFDKINPQFNSLVDIVREFEKVGAGAKDKGDELAKIFGVRSLAGFQILIRQGADAMDILETQITGTEKATEMAEIQINTFKGAMKLLTSVLQEAAIQLGESMQPVLRSLINVIRNVVIAFNSLPPVVKTIVSSILLFGGALGLLISPIALLLAKMPLMIQSIVTMGTSFKVAFASVIGITGVLIGLSVIIGALISQHQEHNKILTEGITKLIEYNDRLILQKQKQQEVVGSYIKLADSQNKSTKKIDEQKSAFDKIKTLYPGLISENDNYRTSLNKLKTVLNDTNIELENLYEKKSKLRSLELRIDISKAKQDLNDINKEVNNMAGDFGSMFDSIGGQWVKLDKSINLTKVLTNTFGDLNTVITDSGFNIEEIKQNLQAILKQQGGVDKIIADEEQLLEYTNNLEVERVKLMTTQLEKGDKFSEVEQNRLSSLDRSLSILSKLNGAYVSVSEMGKQQLEYQTQINEKEIELNDIKKNGLKPPTTPTVIDDISTDITDTEKNRVMQLQSEIFELKKKYAEAELSMLEKYKDESLKDDLAYLDKKHEIEQIDLDSYINQQKDKLTELRASNKELNDLDNYRIKQGEVNEQNYIKEKENINDKWFEKLMSMKDNEFELSQNFNKTDLENWRDTLEEKRIALETKGKQYIDEWADIIKAIKTINNTIGTPELGKIQYQMTVEDNKNKFGNTIYDDALKEYSNYLQEQLKLTNQYKEDYYQILIEMENVKDEIRNRELDKDRFGFLSLRDVAETTANAITSGFDQMWSQWVVGGRKAKSEMDAIWLAIRNSILQSLAEILKSEITKALLKLILTLFGGAVGGAGVAALASVAPPSFPGAAYGADVKKTGFLKVHQGEVVQPAYIVRKNKDFYNNRMNSAPVSNTTENQYNISFVLNNPIVNDKRYWETAAENFIQPAINKISKRFNKS